MKLLAEYCKAHRGRWLLWAAFGAIFWCVFALYELPLSPLGYAALLCLVLGALVGVVGFLDFRARHRRLQELRASITATRAGLPLPQDLLQADYEALLDLLWEDRRAVEAQWEGDTGRIIQYFTLWAHQIKTPIAAMGLILQKEDTPQSRELEAQLFMVEQYVQMAMAYLRMGGESTDYVLRAYPVEPIVRQAVRKYAPMFIRKRVKLDLQPMEWEAVTDEKWLCFAIEQVLSNAVKYTPQGAVSIYLQAPHTLVIADTGVGIAPEDLPRVFERGFTGGNGRLDKRASGIGLYLTREILEKLGHTITIQSQPGQGTQVFIDLGEGRAVWD